MATVYRNQSFKKTPTKNSLKIYEEGENNTGNLSFVLKKKHSIAPQGSPLFFSQKNYPGKFVIDLLTFNK
jgi:hypothetical protein